MSEGPSENVPVGTLVMLTSHHITARFVYQGMEQRVVSRRNRPPQICLTRFHGINGCQLLSLLQQVHVHGSFSRICSDSLTGLGKKHVWEDRDALFQQPFVDGRLQLNDGAAGKAPVLGALVKDHRDPERVLAVGIHVILEFNVHDR